MYLHLYNVPSFPKMNTIQINTTDTKAKDTILRFMSHVFKFTCSKRSPHEKNFGLFHSGSHGNNSLDITESHLVDISINFAQQRLLFTGTYSVLLSEITST